MRNLGFNSGRHDYPDLHKKQEAVPVQVPTFYSVGIKCLTNGNCLTVVVAEGYGGQLPISGFS